MGNLNGIAVSNTPKKRKFPPFRSKRKQKQHRNPETSIIEHSKTQQYNAANVEKSLGLKRVVFISLIGLYQTWNKCPSHILYSAIFILPLKREWIHNPVKYISEIQSNFISHMNLFSDVSEMNAFIKLLKWKDSQGLVFWALNDYPHSAHNTLVAPFWDHFSAQLSTLYNPVTRNTYNALNLDINDWFNKSATNNEYNTNISSILIELCFKTMEYKTMQEIIHESNADSLCPIISWVNEAISCVNRSCDIYDEFERNDAQNWWISEDYNPYDLDD